MVKKNTHNAQSLLSQDLREWLRNYNIFIRSLEELHILITPKQIPINSKLECYLTYWILINTGYLVISYLYIFISKTTRSEIIQYDNSGFISWPNSLPVTFLGICDVDITFTEIPIKLDTPENWETKKRLNNHVRFN